MKTSRVVYALATSLCVGSVTAANLQISPVSITFKTGQTAAGITLQNQGDASVYGQVRAFAWSQRDGEDVLTETADVLVSPPIIDVGPRAAQTIRLVRRSVAPIASELSYRLLIDEIPRGGGPESGVDILLRYSVPVFMVPNESAEPILDWSILRESGARYLAVSNRGRLHAQVGATRLDNQSGQQYELSNGLLGYVLPAQQRRWRLPVEANAVIGGQLQIHAVVNAKPTTYNVDDKRQ